MKTTLIILYFLFFGFIGYGQVKTKVVTVDLSSPHKNSIKICEELQCKGGDSCKSKCKKSKWLSVKSKEMVAIKLVNGNPFKYTYKIDTRNVSFFNEKDELETSTNNAKAEGIKNSNLKNADNKQTSIGMIINYNKDLKQSIESLNFEVQNFYEILQQKKTFEKADYTKRQELRDTAEKYLSKAFELLSDLEKINTKNDDNLNTKESLIETKEKAIKTIETIIHLFYSIDLEVYTLPIDVQGKNIDVVEFKLRRFDKETKDEDLAFASTPYNVWIKNGLKIDVSAGIFFTSLYDSEYDKRDDPTTAGNKIIMLKNSGDYDMAFGSTINTYMRMNSWVVPTLNFGAVITQNEKLQVLLGLGAILGKQERIIFSAGISMGKVDRIADGYQVGSSYNLGDSGNIPTQSQFKFGNFFGITYNLSKVKKINLDKGIEEN